MKYTFHVIGLPHTKTTKEYSVCAYTQKILNFCKMMKSLGHTVIHYGAEGSQVECDEHVTVVTDSQQKKWFGDNDWKVNFFSAKFDVTEEYWQQMNSKTIEEMKSRIKEKDFICIIAGLCQKPIADAFPKHINVEYGIGYEGVFSKYKVFESYAWMHFIYGKYFNDNGQFYDAVIPNYFDPSDFKYRESKKNYYLFIGRLIERKGFQIAIDVTKELCAKLYVVGQGQLENLPDHVTRLTTVGPIERSELMSNAKATFVPTTYLEPFGGVAVESMFCGTPVITSDWGAFPETVKHGVTGYRCRTFEQFVWAAKNINRIKPMNCFLWANGNYSLDRIKFMYQEYFDQLYGLWDQGWYNINNTRYELNWLAKEHHVI